jgi:hypothetical protein
VGKPEGMRRLGKHKLEASIKMDLKEVGLGGVDWLRIGTGGRLL